MTNYKELPYDVKRVIRSLTSACMSANQLLEEQPGFANIHVYERTLASLNCALEMIGAMIPADMTLKSLVSESE